MDYAKHLAAGALSSVVGRTALAPLERLKLDMVLHRKTGMRRLAVEIFECEGILGFWKGNVINCLRTSPHKASCFTPNLRNSQPGFCARHEVVY